MSPERSYVKVEDLMPQVSIQQAAALYGVPLPELHETGQELRTQCFLNCPKACETGPRAIAIRRDSDVKQWKCHQYDCDKGGNLISMMDLMKPGPNMGGRPRGERFKAIRADLLAIVGGGAPAPAAAPSSVPQEAAKAPTQTQIKRNVPLKDSANERARPLVTLDEKFQVDPSQAMNKHAAAYFDDRPYLTPEVCRKWRVGYLPGDAGGDRTGGTMRSKIVYPILDESGDVLTWFGRDPTFEEKHQQWIAGGRQGLEPEKFHYVKGFYRGLELFGQHAVHGGDAERMTETGLFVVEGPNDVIAAAEGGEIAVGLCSNQATHEQLGKIARLAHTHAAGRVTMMLDGDAGGEKGAKQAVWDLSQHCNVRSVWLPSRQPESLSSDEWATLRRSLAERGDAFRADPSE